MRPRFVRATALLTILSAVTGPIQRPASAQQRHFPSDSAIQAILDEQVGKKGTVGVVLGVLDRDGSRRVFTAGKADNGALKLDGATVFEIGSINKTFTTALLAEMASRGEVRLDDPVQKYLPATVKMPARNGRQITLLDLAKVNSGLPGMPDNFKPVDPTNPYADYTIQQMYDFLSGYTLTRDIGSKYEYSNLGMGLLGHVLALRAGKSYFDLLDERILRPLGMKETVIDLTPALRKRLALGHDPKGRIVSNWDIPTLAGAGALRSTVDDMLRYLAANLDSTSQPLGGILATTHVSRSETGSPGLTVGMGWHILKSPSGTITWHNGGTGGYRAFMGFDVAKKVGVIVLTNSAITADDVGLHLIDPAIPLSKPPVARKEIALDPSVLPQYAGVYELAPTFSLTMTVENDALWVEPTGQPKTKLAAESDGEFFLKDTDIKITFQKDPAGKVTGLVLFQGGGSAPGKKVR